MKQPTFLLWIPAIMVSLAACSDQEFAGGGGKSGARAGQDEEEDCESDCQTTGGKGTTDGQTLGSSNSGTSEIAAGADQTSAGGVLTGDVATQVSEPPFVDIFTGTGTVRCFEVVDTAGTQEIGNQANPRGAGGPAIRDLVNKACQADISNNWHDAGMVKADQATGDVVCNILGYKRMVQNNTQAFSSPGDNTIGGWDGTAKKFTVVGARAFNAWLGWVKCQEKLADRCLKDVKIKCN